MRNLAAFLALAVLLMSGCLLLEALTGTQKGDMKCHSSSAPAEEKRSNKGGSMKHCCENAILKNAKEYKRTFERLSLPAYAPQFPRSTNPACSFRFSDQNVLFASISERLALLSVLRI